LPPTVRWTTYKAEIGAYQGALEHKEKYTKRFMMQTPESLAAGGYDLTQSQCRAAAEPYTR